MISANVLTPAQQGAAPDRFRSARASLRCYGRLNCAVSDITGTTGMSIIRAIVAGDHDPQTLAALRHPRSH